MKDTPTSPGRLRGKAHVGQVAKICKGSGDTALHDINNLIAKGLLRRDESAGGRSMSYVLIKGEGAASV